MRSLPLLLLLTSFACSQDLNSTDGLANGRFWLKLAKDAKVVYLMGATDGARKMTDQIQSTCFREATFQAQDAYKKTAAETFDRYFKAGNTLTRAEIVEEIDAFYTEPANRPTPIMGTLYYVAARLNGLSKGV